MIDSPFPSEVPLIGDLVRITPVKQDFVPRHYKSFSEEAHVSSRFFGIDYADRRYVIVSLGSDRIREIHFNRTTATWSTYFDGQIVQVEVEKLLE